MAAGSSCTIVEYFGGDDGYRCGYCKNEKGNFSHGKILFVNSLGELYCTVLRFVKASSLTLANVSQPFSNIGQFAR